jgi:hypothetical protein
MFAIRYLAVGAALRLFAGFGAFMLERIMKSWIDADAGELEKVTESPAFCHATRKLKPSARIRRSPIGHQSPRFDLRDRQIRSTRA